MLITTTPNIEGKRIKEYLGIVTGEAVVGANLFRDLFAGIRDDTILPLLHIKPHQLMCVLSIARSNTARSGPTIKLPLIVVCPILLFAC
jgi:hypothetical protein